ncbi:MAG: hypothetical protein A2100_03145 [Sideroxydans sp. GWF2_59_14]|nr:MAG: hypothetical protein A2100_03145 [Sideroxydans sp. GWF2_59_14]
MNEEVKFGDLIRKALDQMGDKPNDLAKVIGYTADIQEVEFPEPIKWLTSNLKMADANSAIFHAVGLALRKWDRSEDGNWTNGTIPFSEERRIRIYQRLALHEEVHAFMDERMPVFQEADRALVIAEEHEKWYSERILRDGFYWKAYSGYLQATKKWDEDSVAKLDESTDEVVLRLSDPCGNKVYSSKGLVVGYVQSGKTAHFSGVLAKAADAGYRFIIVLAGTLDILRSQTQRRLDKEIVGKELLVSDYGQDSDWHEFVSHEGIPSEMGSFDWERLTGPKEDYKELNLAIKALEFKSKISGKPYNDPENLRTSPLRIIVIKKIPKVMARLARDLAKIKQKLAHVPTLIVDDESDQASINTIDPTKAKRDNGKTRTETNKEIVNLLKALPRAQYLGYTATPFANVFVDPNDTEDLFPKDFIISLPRPNGYMGVMDFYDFDVEPEGFESNKNAFVRDVFGEDCGGDTIQGKKNPNHLQRAIDSFVIAGAIKLYREHHSGKKLFFKHHTMLVHHSVRNADQDILAEKVRAEFDNAGYHAGKGVSRLESLFSSDFLPVTQAKGKQFPMPNSFKELAPFIGPCLAKLTQQKTVLIVNGENKDDTPDFDKGSVWAILVGGAKLSRGYTVEGLTTTYFRRVSSTTDTLMQMGRWFGYRSGYIDLVRLFIGRDEPFGNKGKVRLDLYEAFKAICRDEEKFRDEIKKYKDGLTPKQIPPLVPSHLTTLRPTAKNKMYNAYIIFKNFSGNWSESTLAPSDQKVSQKNEELAKQLLKLANLHEYQFLGKKVGKDGKLDGSDTKAFCGLVKNEDMQDFLQHYQWRDARPIMQHEIEFLKGTEGDPGIDDWLVIAPIVAEKRGYWPKVKAAGIAQIPIQHRTKVGVRFGAYSTSSHRAIAEYISCTSDTFRPSNNEADALKNSRRAVMLFYPVNSDPSEFVSIGFSLLFPINKIQRKIQYSVRDASRKDEIVVPLSSSDS